MNAGELRTCLELQRKVETRTAAGGTKVTWKRVRDVFCNVKALSAQLKLEAKSREPQITHEITARQENDIDATKRLVLGARTFMIDGIPEDEDERGAFVKMQAVEGVAT